MSSATFVCTTKSRRGAGRVSTEALLVSTKRSVAWTSKRKAPPSTPYVAASSGSRTHDHRLPSLALLKESLKRGRRSQDRKSTRLNSSHANISYAVFCLKKKKNI